MELHDHGKFICKVLRMSRISKTTKVKQFGSTEPLEIQNLLHLIVPSGSGVVPYLGAKFAVFADEQPQTSAMPIQVNSVTESAEGDVLEVAIVPS